jgi:heterotetrameric sarcosine oxidase delta subunit
MLLITCPHCGPRNDDEFSFKGEVVPRPPVEAAESGTWRAYLYMRRNVSGWQVERWFHVSGCRRFLEVERNTATNEIRRVEEIGRSRP